MAHIVGDESRKIKCLSWKNKNLSDYNEMSQTNRAEDRRYRRFQEEIATVMFLSFRTDRSGQTVQTQILEEQFDQGLHCLQFPLHLSDALL